MFPEFFKNKMRKVGSFLKIMRGKATSNDQINLKERGEVGGVDSDVNERYRLEHPLDPADKVLRESGGQDISAI